MCKSQTIKTSWPHRTHITRLKWGFSPHPLLCSNHTGLCTVFFLECCQLASYLKRLFFCLKVLLSQLFLVWLLHIIQVSTQISPSQKLPPEIKVVLFIMYLLIISCDFITLCLMFAFVCASYREGWLGLQQHCLFKTNYVQRSGNLILGEHVSLKVHSCQEHSFSGSNKTKRKLDAETTHLI